MRHPTFCLFYFSFFEVRHKGVDTLKCRSDMFHRISIRNSGKALSAISEGVSRYNGATVVIEKCFTELFARESELSNRRKDVKCPLRLKGIKTNVRKSVVDIFASAIVFFCHPLDVFITVAKSFGGGNLRCCWCAHDGELVDLQHLL